MRTRKFDCGVEVRRDGVIITELAIEETPMIMMDKASAIKASLTGTYRQAAGVNWLTDELAPYVIINNVKSYLGVFCPATVREIVSDEMVKTVRVEAYDRGLYLQQIKTDGILHKAAGTLYTTVISDLFTAAGIVFSLTPSAATLPADAEWDMGTDYLTIINGLLEELNYNPVWFDDRGFAIAAPYRDPDARNIDHSYDGTTQLSVLCPDYAAERDWYDAPNKFVVVCDNPDLEEPLVATATNINPTSDLSTIVRGRTITSIVKVDNIADQTTLQAYADKLCKQSMMQASVTTVHTAIMPGHGCGDIVAINHPLVTGIFEELGWSIRLELGQTMSHSLKQVSFV